MFFIFSCKNEQEIFCARERFIIYVKNFEKNDFTFIQNVYNST